jgi:hypothetical protein
MLLECSGQAAQVHAPPPTSPLSSLSEPKKKELREENTKEFLGTWGEKKLKPAENGPIEYWERKSAEMADSPIRE